MAVAVEDPLQFTLSSPKKSSRRTRKRKNRNVPEFEQRAKDGDSESIQHAIDLLDYRPVKSILLRRTKRRLRSAKEKSVDFDFDNNEHYEYPCAGQNKKKNEDSGNERGSNDQEEKVADVPAKRAKSKKAKSSGRGRELKKSCERKAAPRKNN